MLVGVADTEDDVVVDGDIVVEEPAGGYIMQCIAVMQVITEQVWLTFTKHAVSSYNTLQNKIVKITNFWLVQLQGIEEIVI